MPSGFASLDTSFPNLEGKTTEQKLQTMTDYLYQLLEQLRYTLHNLGVENLNPESLNELGKIISDPIYAEITDETEGLSTRITANSNAITAEVTRATGAEGTISTRVTQNADAITAEASRATGAEATLTLTAQGLRTDVNAASGAASSAQQTADGIKAQVTDGQGNYTVLNLKSGGLYVGNAQGATKISGSNITAGSVTATQIAAHTITGDELHANVALSAPVITGGSITGAEVTSKTRAPGLSYDSVVKVTDGEVAFYYGATLYGKLGIYDAMGNLIFRTENDVALKLSAPLKLDSNSYGGTLPSGLGISDAGRLFFKI